MNRRLNLSLTAGERNFNGVRELQSIRVVDRQQPHSRSDDRDRRGGVGDARCTS